MANEEKGYWFSTENGTHIHAEEGESKEQAMSKKFSNFGKGKKEEKGLKTESRTTQNEMQSNDPGKLADKMEESQKQIHETFKDVAKEHSKNYNETDRKVIDLIKQGKSNEEIATILEKEDKTGEFDYYESLDYVDNLRDESGLLEESEPKQEKTENYDNDPEVEKESQDIISSGEKHTYMMLDRMRSDLEYALGTVAETRKNHPEWFASNSDKISDFHSIWWSEKPYKQIALMRKLHNSLKEKPEWLTMEQINDFEKRVKEHLGK